MAEPMASDSCAVSDHSEGNNEITLYKDNQPLLKAECGVPLGLLKLIYSSDDSYNGVLLGVKPRLSNRAVPCLVTFDSTSLTHPEYDLIVQAVQPAVHSQRTTNREWQNCAIPQMPIISTEGNENNSGDSPHTLASSSSAIIQSDQITNEPRTSESPSSDLPGDNRYIHWTSQSSTNQSPRLSPEPFNHDHPLPSQQESASSETFLNVDHGIMPDSTVKESEIAGFAVSKGRDETSTENSYPDFEASAEIQFNPEEFNFDIGSVIPFQSDKGMRWPCDRCGKDFCSSSHLKRHWILHTDFKPHKCTVCGKCFPFQWDLKRHMTKHTGDKPFKCSSCPKTFNTREEQKNHNWLHTGKKEHQCRVCHREFSTQSNLNVHMRKHTGEKPYKCEYCPKSFYMQGHYQYHVRRHTGEKPYKCDICGKTFSYSNNLNEHKNVHTGNRPYSCSQCDKKFTHRSTFKQHLLMHQGHKRYKCHVCSKSFVQCSNYQRHILTHKKKEERVQKCDLCGKELLSRRGIQEHRLRCVKKTKEQASANEATKSRPKRRGEYRCEHCPRIFAYSRRLEAHVTKKHPPSTEVSTMKPSIMPIVEQANASELTPRKKNHRRKRGEYHCEHCPKIFANSRSFEVHVKKKHSEDSSSKQTGALGSPNVQATWHHAMRRKLGVQCSVCGRRFGYAKRLRAHLLKDHQPIAPQRSSSTAVPQTSESQSNTTEEIGSTVPVSAERDNVSRESGDLTGYPADTIPRVIHPDASANSQPTRELAKTANIYLPLDGKDKQEAGETGFEALSALSRLSAKIGMEGNISTQSFPAPGVSSSGIEVTVQIRL